MRTDVPASALSDGFLNDPVGTHTSRTIMVRELAKVLAATPLGADSAELRKASLSLNAVEKPTIAGRAKTFRHLRELYSMDPSVAVFRALRLAWTGNTAERPLLAVLCAMARDPVFRATATTTTRAPIGSRLESSEFAREVTVEFPGHYSPGVTARIGRNIASSWTQSGHLMGRTRKHRVPVHSGPASLAYALYLGHLAGASGKRLFDTVWTLVLDRSPAELEVLAARASRQGWIEYRAGGGMVDVTFRHFEADDLEAGIPAAAEA